MDAKYKEQGTDVSGYWEEGKAFCGSCIHLSDPNSSSCIHPVVLADPDLQSKLVQIETGPAIQIDRERGCCRFVHLPSVVALVMRHGDTVLNAEGKLRSRLDVDIDEEGQKQAQDAAKFILANYPGIKRIITTPLKRTQQTVAPLATALGIAPEIDPSIQTWHMGVLIGAKKDDVKDTLNFYVENPDEQIPQGESLNEVLARAMPSLEQYLEEAEEDPITLICMTSSVIVPLIKFINGNPIAEPGADTGVGPGGVLAITVSGDGYEIKPVFGEVKPAEVGAS